MIELTFLKEFMLIGQCDICHYWCHDVLRMSMNLSDIAILNIHSADYRCIISGISKSEAVNLLHNIDLTEKAQHYKT